MPSYKLTYFNGRGRAELSRLVFAAAGKQYEDVRITSADWSTLKAEMPQGTVPVLDVDGKFRISQSLAIARYLAREFDICGKNNREMSIIDQFSDTCLDVVPQIIKMTFNSDKEEAAKQRKDFEENTLPKHLGILEALVKETGVNGFAVGQSLTLGDLILYNHIESCKVDNVLEKYPILAANRKMIGELPRIKEYIKARPETSF